MAEVFKDGSTVCALDEEGQLFEMMTSVKPVVDSGGGGVDSGGDALLGRMLVASPTTVPDAGLPRLVVHCGSASVFNESAML